MQQLPQTPHQKNGKLDFSAGPKNPKVFFDFFSKLNVIAKINERILLLQANSISTNTDAKDETVEKENNPEVRNRYESF